MLPVTGRKSVATANNANGIARPAGGSSYKCHVPFAGGGIEAQSKLHPSLCQRIRVEQRRAIWGGVENLKTPVFREFLIVVDECGGPVAGIVGRLAAAIAPVRFPGL
jgi:hypothetical protein